MTFLWAIKIAMQGHYERLNLANKDKIKQGLNYQISPINNKMDTHRERHPMYLWFVLWLLFFPFSNAFTPFAPKQKKVQTQY